tara:strand:+ start:1789 stop:2076 length:288 start_codon:yes stop_codon:yes gene_type:complete
MIEKIIIITITTANIFSFLLIILDKHLSKNQLKRIPENQLFFLALLGGWFLGTIGMKLIRHKTSKRSFQIKYLISSSLNIVIIFLFFFSTQIGWW